ncbi:MAG: hypothetical protein R2771_03065 [Saprospiraceae bacterium]
MMTVNCQTYYQVNTGDIYFTTEEVLDDRFISRGFGAINKYDSQLKNLEWSLLMPTDYYIDNHKFKIYDLMEAKNGDIIACGTVWEERPGGAFVESKDNKYVGFITRITKEGEYVWFREYRVPAFSELLTDEEYGKFMYGSLLKTIELDDGRIVAGGIAYYNSYEIINAGETESFLWLMIVNENGCLDGEECEEIIELILSLIIMKIRFLQLVQNGLTNFSLTILIPLPLNIVM